MKRDFLEQRVNFGVVLKLNLSDVSEIKRAIAEIPDVYIVYQKTALNKLYIKENNEGR